MKDCVQSMLDDFSEDTKETAMTPAADHLFHVREALKLNKTKANKLLTTMLWNSSALVLSSLGASLI